MNRAQRKAHARTWPFLALAMVTIIGLALAAQHRVTSLRDAAYEWAPR